MKAYENAGELVICLSGSLDSERAPAAEQEIRGIIAEHPGCTVCVDAEDLTYISSSGLRILLRLSKEQKEPLRMVNVSPEVYDVLSITGFTELLDAHRKPREISLEGCPVIGSGAVGTVYRLDGDTIVKIYSGGASAIPVIEKERDISKRAFVYGVPTAIPFDVVRAGDSYGAAYEMVNAQSCNDMILEHPECLDEILGRYCDFLKSINRLEVPPGILPEARTAYLQQLERVSANLDEDTYRKLDALLRALPQDLHLLHGDAHMKNVMDSDGDLMFIDMDTLCTGSEIFELAALFMTYVAFNEDEPDNSMRFLGISKETADHIFGTVLERCLGNGDPARLRKNEPKVLLLGYIRFLYVHQKFAKKKDSELTELRIRHSAAHLRELAGQVTTLELEA